jgi:hypothetical protein
MKNMNYDDWKKEKGINSCPDLFVFVCFIMKLI